ncbi:MAG TPA: ATP-binding protein [Burkholderiaceae bacterium]|nr:ATP-binding protein [Burkholderiaceae bacterium]
MLGLPLVLGASFAYLLLLFAVAWWADRRALEGRAPTNSAWIYTLSIGVYCTAWTYFGSVGRAATSGLWFLPIYLGPTLAMLLAWTLLRKMVRIARTHRITSIADFVASRYGKSRTLAALVTLIALVGILPYIALQLKAIASGLSLLTGSHDAAGTPWWQDSTLAIALVLAGFTIAFGTRHLDASERHPGMVAAIALESVVKLAAFVAVGVFVCWGLFDGPADIFRRAAAEPTLAPLLGLVGASGGQAPFAGGQWFALTLLSMLSLLMLPRQFQVMVVENVDERHLRRATWAFPLYLLLINLFVLPIALGGLLHFASVGQASANPETFVLSLPLALGQPGLALIAFVGGLSAATGMVIVESIAVATMVCNDLVMPALLKAQPGRDFSRLPLAVRRVVIVALLLLGYLYFRVAGEAYALVSIGLISFAAVAQFAPALIGGMYWKGGTRAGALAGLAGGFTLWAWTLLLPSIAKSGWLPLRFVSDGPWGLDLLRPEQLLGLSGLDSLTHALLWSLLANVGLYVAVSLARAPSAREAAQALRFVDVFRRDDTPADAPLRWRSTRAQASPLAELRQLATRFLGAEAAERAFAGHPPQAAPDARLVRQVETQLAGAIGSASAHAMVATVVEEEPLARSDLLRVLDEASQVRELNRQLEALDRLKDDFMSSVTHELRTPLTSIRAFAELMRDDPAMDAGQRQQFLALVVAETERLSRLVNQVLDMAKIESGHGEWRNEAIDLGALIDHAVATTSEAFRARGATVTVDKPAQVPVLQADRDRLLQVLINLLSNAAKFTPPGHGRVEVRLRCDARVASVEVCDNGPGVPPEQQQLVFEKFRQGGSATNRPQGTGLGLPISRRIVEHYGGRIWLRSAPGQGACFAFELPWQHDEETPT